MSDEQINYVGSAFPVLCRSMAGLELRDPGITMRDYFAAKAMNGLLASGADYDVTDLGIADSAYKIADAMIAERIAK